MSAHSDLIVFTFSPAWFALAIGFLVGFCSHLLLCWLRQATSQARQTYQAKATLAKARMDFALRERAEITKFGTVEVGTDGKEFPTGFSFKLGEMLPSYTGPDGDRCIAGWTIPELIAIAKQATRGR